MSRRNPRVRARPARRRTVPTCTGLVMWLAVTVSLMLIVFSLFVRPQISAFVGRRVGAEISNQVEQRVGVQQQLEDQADAALPGAVAALPKGELTLSEADANSFVEASPRGIAPLQAMTLRFVPGEVQANLTAFDTQSQLRAGLAAQDGRIVIVDPQLDGPLNIVLSADDIAASVEERLNAELQTQNQTISDLRVDQGQVVLVVE